MATACRHDSTQTDRNTASAEHTLLPVAARTRMDARSCFASVRVGAAPSTPAVDMFVNAASLGLAELMAASRSTALLCTAETHAGA